MVDPTFRDFQEWKKNRNVAQRHPWVMYAVERRVGRVDGELALGPFGGVAGGVATGAWRSSCAPMYWRGGGFREKRRRGRRHSKVGLDLWAVSAVETAIVRARVD